MAVSCGPQWTGETPEPAPPLSTLERALGEAQAGDPFWENVAGYLLLTGHDPPPDAPPALELFESAADRGSSVARLNLAIAYWLGLSVERDVELAEFWFLPTLRDPAAVTLLHLSTVESLVSSSCADPTHELARGREVFVTFCSGCHGADGVAAYPLAPSFAFGDRMEKSDRDLIESILWGHEDMPNWDDKLPRPWLAEALAYARTLESEFGYGLLRLSIGPHELRFSFGPMDRPATPDPEPFAVAATGPPGTPSAQRPVTLLDRCAYARATLLPREP